MFYRCEDLRRVESDAAFEDDGGLADIPDIGPRIAIDQYEIGAFAGTHRPYLLIPPQVNGAIQRTDADGLRHAKAAFYQQLDLAVVTIPGATM